MSLLDWLSEQWNNWGNKVNGPTLNGTYAGTPIPKGFFASPTDARKSDGPTTQFASNAYAPHERYSDSRDTYYTKQQTAGPQMDQSPQGMSYEDILSMINSLGASGSFNMKAAQADLNKAYSPAFDALNKLRGDNKKQNKADIRQVLGIYNMLSGDYTKTAGKTGKRYDAQSKKTSGDYSGAAADINSRYDKQIADLTAQLTKLGQTQTLDSEISKLNEQRNLALNNVTQSGTRAKTSYGQQKNAIMDYFTTGATGAKLQGADKAAELKNNLAKALAALDNNQMQLEQSRAGDLAKAQSSWAATVNDGRQAQLDALFKLANLQRDDALAQYKMGQPQQQDTSKMNLMNKAAYYLSGTGVDPSNAVRYNQMFQDMVLSNGDLVNGNFTPGGQTSPIKMTVSRAMQIASDYANSKGLPAGDAKILRDMVIASYQ